MFYDQFSFIAKIISSNLVIFHFKTFHFFDILNSFPPSTTFCKMYFVSFPLSHAFI